MKTRVTSLVEAHQHIESLTIRVSELEKMVIDQQQRFDTLQTRFWKRLWFWIQGWPMHDLNAPKKDWRPW